MGAAVAFVVTDCTAVGRKHTLERSGLLVQWQNGHGLMRVGVEWWFEPTTVHHVKNKYVMIEQTNNNEDKKTPTLDENEEYFKKSGCSQIALTLIAIFLFLVGVVVYKMFT